MLRQKLRRKHPLASEAEIEARVQERLQGAVRQLSQGQQQLRELLQVHSNAEDLRWHLSQRQIQEQARHQAQELSGKPTQQLTATARTP